MGYNYGFITNEQDAMRRWYFNLAVVDEKPTEVNYKKKTFMQRHFSGTLHGLESENTEWTTHTPQEYFDRYLYKADPNIYHIIGWNSDVNPANPTRYINWVKMAVNLFVSKGFTKLIIGNLYMQDESISALDSGLYDDLMSVCNQHENVRLGFIQKTGICYAYGLGMIDDRWKFLERNFIELGQVSTRNHFQYHRLFSDRNQEKYGAELSMVVFTGIHEHYDLAKNAIYQSVHARFETKGYRKVSGVLSLEEAYKVWFGSFEKFVEQDFQRILDYLSDENTWVVFEHLGNGNFDENLAPFELMPAQNKSNSEKKPETSLVTTENERDERQVDITDISNLTKVYVQSTHKKTAIRFHPEISEDNIIGAITDTGMVAHINTFKVLENEHGEWKFIKWGEFSELEGWVKSEFVKYTIVMTNTDVIPSQEISSLVHNVDYSINVPVGDKFVDDLLEVIDKVWVTLQEYINKQYS